jgi:L-asparaginase
MLDSLPELSAIADIEEVSFPVANSHALRHGDWLVLLSKIHQLFDDDRCDALVLGHGTNTLEETAYFLNLTLRTDRPVVMVGSMRPSSGLSTDGFLNVLNAVRVAASPGCVGRGVLVMLNDTIFAARGVTKASTYRVNAFVDRDYGPIGYADADGTVVWRRHEERLHTVATEFDVRDLEDLPRVDIVTSHIGADGALINASVRAGARGIVSAGTGAGRPTPAEDQALDLAISQGVVVCQASRVGSGRVIPSAILKQRRIVSADDLIPWKARILLSLVLTVTTDVASIQRAFDLY